VIPVSLSEVARLCPGQLDVAAGADAVTGVTIDSRRVEPGDLFVAVGGGVDFRGEALARGAAAALLPDDPFVSLAALGGAVRDRSQGEVVGVTGSTGKTSTKDILAALCRPHRRTVATEASYNAELGVPLTLCRLEPDTELCVLELAMRGPGQIAELCAFARPAAGVITNIAPVHLERVGSLEGVAAAKAELLAALPAGAPAVVPAGVPALDALLRTDLRYLRTGEDVRLTRFEPPLLVVDVGGTSVVLDVPFTAPHQAQNAVTAVAAYVALGLPLSAVGRGAGEIVFSRWRGEELPLPGGGVLLNDTWNANPLAMAAALEHLRRLAAGRRMVAVLGGMAELGPEASRYHREVGDAMRQAGVEVLVAVGSLARGYLEAGPPETIFVESVPEAVEVLRSAMRDGDAVLVKGSRVLAMERIAEALALDQAALGR
jgi:UDP-N-acetylmuramoyl-tripeptide--D-alanyl-D-alanine ligase